MIAPSDILLDSLTEVVFQTDPRGNWTYLNQAWTRVFGYSVEESLGKNFLEFVHPDECAATIQLFQSVVTGKLSYCHRAAAFSIGNTQLRGGHDRS